MNDFELTVPDLYSFQARIHTVLAILQSSFSQQDDIDVMLANMS